MLANRKWSLSPVPDLVLEVDVAKLRGAMLNLIDNAVRATKESDIIEIRAVHADHDGPIELSVEGFPDQGFRPISSTKFWFDLVGWGWPIKKGAGLDWR